MERKLFLVLLSVLFLVCSFPGYSEDAGPRKVGDKLNRDAYNPPVGGYAWQDDDNSALGKLSEARKAVEVGDLDKAWECAEESIMLSSKYSTKLAVRDLLYKCGSPEPEALDTDEMARTGVRIGEERLRYYRELSPTTKLGKIALIKLLYKTIEDCALSINELDNLKDPDELEREYLINVATKSDSQVKELAGSANWKTLKTKATEAEKAGDHELAYRMLYAYRAELMRTKNMPEELEPTDDKMEEVGRKVLDAVPEVDRKLLHEAENNPVWDKLEVFPSRHFLFIVPGSVKNRITKDSILRLDLAFALEADLFSVTGEKLGERISVYLKELWSFSGGRASGNQIMIGYKYAMSKGDPAVVDSYLYTHELAHCMTVGYFPLLITGFIEGIANMGMVFCEDVLGRHGSAVEISKQQCEKGKKEYLDRTIPYYRLPEYESAFTVMTTPLLNLPLVNGCYDWGKMRQAMRDFKSFPVPMESYFYFAWGWVKSLEPYFGESVYDFYEKCRFPVSKESKALIQDDIDFYRPELNAARTKDMLIDLEKRIRRENPASYCRQLALFALLDEADRRNDKEGLIAAKRNLGILEKAMVLGPVDRYNVKPSPLSTVKYDTQYRTSKNTVKWKETESDTRGEFTVIANYEGTWAGYVLTFVNCEEPTDALIWMRSVVGFAVWNNDESVCSYSNTDIWTAYNNFFRFHPTSDYLYVPVKLQKGWNKIIARFDFTGGDGSIRLRMTDPVGSPLEGVEFSNENHDSGKDAPESWSIGKQLFEDEFKSVLSSRKWKTGCGKFNTSSGKLCVLSGKDGDPEPVLWMLCETLKTAQGYRLILNAIPKDDRTKAYVLKIAFDGNGGKDFSSAVVLTITLDTVLTWEFSSDGRTVEKDISTAIRQMDEYEIRVERFLKRWTLFINDEAVFENLMVSSVNNGTIGLTFEPDVKMGSIALYELEGR